MNKMIGAGLMTLSAMALVACGGSSSPPKPLATQDDVCNVYGNMPNASNITPAIIDQVAADLSRTNSAPAGNMVSFVQGIIYHCDPLANIPAINGSGS